MDMTSYQPELLGLFQRIFDEIWQELEPNVSQDDEERRSELARRIILAHRRGLGPDRLRATVLKEMTAKLSERPY